MAAVSHLKNKKEAKVRDDIEKIVNKCQEDGNVSVKLYRDVLGAAGVEIDSRESHKLDKLTDEDGFMNRQEFHAYARKSSAIQEYLHHEKSKGIDKAELAFKAIDKDGSGYIDASELSKLGKMGKAQQDALMHKLDKDGDGKITLEEFRHLFIKTQK